MQETDVDCITELEVFRVHLHPSILETFFKMKKNWKKTIRQRDLEGNFLTSNIFDIVFCL